MAFNAVDSGIPCGICGDTKRYKYSHKCVHCNRIASASENSKKLGDYMDKMPGKIADEDKIMAGVKYE